MSLRHFCIAGEGLESAVLSGRLVALPGARRCGGRPGLLRSSQGESLPLNAPENSPLLSCSKSANGVWPGLLAPLTCMHCQQSIRHVGNMSSWILRSSASPDFGSGSWMRSGAGKFLALAPRAILGGSGAHNSCLLAVALFQKEAFWPLCVQCLRSASQQHMSYTYSQIITGP